MTLSPRVVIVHRATELDELLERHGTRQQAAFFLRTRGTTLDVVEERHAAVRAAIAAITNAIPLAWRRGIVERSELCRFLFSADDLVVAVGQDGLVANVAKYLDGQPVIGVNPDPGRNPGVLVAHAPAAAASLIAAVRDPTALPVERRTMVRARLDDGQTLLALNEIFVGHRSHQSARYRLTDPTGATERQSSSGLLVGTGTGSTGWCQSVWRERHSRLTLPTTADPTLCWFVREAWPSPATGTALTEGVLAVGDSLSLSAESDLVTFGDGIEDDALSLTWGQRAEIGIAERSLALVRP